MGRKPSDTEPTRWGFLILLLMGIISCSVVYTFMSSVSRNDKSSSNAQYLANLDGDSRNLVPGESGECCKGIQSLELWGAAVKWGSSFKVNSSVECCNACKAMCTGNDEPCLCDTWVFCGNKDLCESKFGECWLKRQTDNLAPDKQEAASRIMWTSGLVYGRGEGIVGLETEYGTIHIKLLPDCAPHSVAYILELVGLRHCAGCQIYRAEGRGKSWDSHGNHIKDASFGPPFGLIQGTLNAHGSPHKDIPSEFCPTIKRGSVAWIGPGPEFFISLANHVEWKNSYTVFATVIPEDMSVAEKIAQLPTKSDVWENINVAVLEKPVPLFVKRMKKTNQGASTHNSS